MNTNDLILQLSNLGMTTQEARVYHALLKSGPKTHLQLSRDTGINRSKVYRIADDLKKRSIITDRTDDRGKFLVAASPETLGVEITNLESSVIKSKEAYSNVLPVLSSLAESQSSPINFVVKTYEGVEGFKQMLWNELKVKDEVLVFGSGTLEDLVDDKNWAEKHRQKTVDLEYSMRELLNPGGKPANFTENKDFFKNFQKRIISESKIKLTHQISIYNDTVATYCYRDGQKVGYEVTNKAYAEMYRQIFESYWGVAG